MLMVLYLFIEKQPLGLSWRLWIIGSIIGAIGVIVIDIKRVWPAAQRYTWQKNPEWTDFKKEFKELQRDVQELKDEIHRLRNS